MRIIKSCKYDSEAVLNLGTKLWDILPGNIKKAESLQDFKDKIKFWAPLNFPCKLCKTYIANVGYVSVFSFMRFQFPNLLNASTYDSITCLMRQLLFGIVWWIGILIIYICKISFHL